MTRTNIRRNPLKGWTALACAVAFAAPTVQADVVVVAANGSSIPPLSRNQVAEIFLGKFSEAPDGRPVVPIDLAESSAVREEFYTVFASKSAPQLRSYWTRMVFIGRGLPPRTANSPGEVKALLAANLRAIAYLDRRDVDASLKIVGQK